MNSNKMKLMLTFHRKLELMYINSIEKICINGYKLNWHTYVHRNGIGSVKWMTLTLSLTLALKIDFGDLRRSKLRPFMSIMIVLNTQKTIGYGINISISLHMLHRCFGARLKRFERFVLEQKIY